MQAGEKTAPPPPPPVSFSRPLGSGGGISPRCAQGTPGGLGVQIVDAVGTGEGAAACL